MNTPEIIGGDGQLFVGEDKALEMDEIVDADGDLVDFTGWAISFVISLRDGSAALVTKTATISGTFNSDRTLNTLKATVTLSAADTGALSPRTYRHSWKRTDAGSKTILHRGDIVFEKANSLP